MSCARAFRVSAALASAFALAVTGGLASLPSAAAQGHPRAVRLNTFEARLLTDMNRARQHRHLAPLTIVAGATDVARQWSWQLARVETLSHNPRLVRRLEHAGSSRWTEIEENVGFGPVTSPDTLFRAYMNSPEHRSNILAKDVRFVGVGVVQRGDYAWNTVDFVNQYSPSYGASRVPTDGISTDAVTPDTTTVLASGARHDSRFGAARTIGVTASRVHFSGGATRARFSGHADRGHGALFFRDALSLRHVTALRFRLGALSQRHVPVRVNIKIGNGWRMRTLKAVRAGDPRTVTVALPRNARRLLTTIEFSVSGRSLRSAAHRVTLSVANLTAVATTSSSEP